MQWTSFIRVCIFCIILPLQGYANEEKNATETFYIAVNIENELSSIDKMNLVNIYLGKHTLWNDGNRVLPAMLKENQASMKQFIELILNKTIPQYRAYWKRRLFSGGGTVPKTYKSSQKLVNYVGRVSGSIGIVSEKIEHRDVKYITINTGSVISK